MKINQKNKELEHLAHEPAVKLTGRNNESGLATQSLSKCFIDDKSISIINCSHPHEASDLQFCEELDFLPLAEMGDHTNTSTIYPSLHGCQVG
jgi:hypothetical protein